MLYSVLVQIKDPQVRRALEGSGQEVFDAVVVQEERVQVVEAVEGAWMEFHYVVEPKIAGNWFEYFVSVIIRGFSCAKESYLSMLFYLGL